MTTFSEAKLCPKCDQPGEDTGAKPTKRQGVLVHTILCRNKTCEWFDTGWLVQINEDGSIPDAYAQIGEKQFPKISQESETRIQEAIDAQLAAETRPGSEIRNPRS